MLNYVIINTDRKARHIMTGAELRKLVKKSEKGYRVDVVSLAKALNVPVYSVDLPDEQSGHISDGENPHIEVNQNHPVTRQRFTIAHELSHFVKHQDLLKAKGQLDRKTEYEDVQELAIEEEADKTAAEILMPEELVNEYMEKHKLTKLTRFNAHVISQMAEEFRVSRAMAITRLRDLDINIPYLTFA